MAGSGRLVKKMVGGWPNNNGRWDFEVGCATYSNFITWWLMWVHCSCVLM